MFCKKLNRDCKFYSYCNGEKIKNKENFFDSKNFKKHYKIEELLYEFGFKKLYKYQYVHISKVNSFIKNIKIGRSYFFGVYSIIENETYEKEFLNDGFVNIVISENKSNIKDFIFYDNNIDYRIRIIQTGKLLGYPECCIKEAVKQSKNLISMERFDKNDKKISGICPLLSSKIRLYVHFSCSNNCLKTIEMSEKVLYELSKIGGEKIIYDFFYKNKI